MSTVVTKKLIPLSFFFSNRTGLLTFDLCFFCFGGGGTKNGGGGGSTASFNIHRMGRPHNIPALKVAARQLMCGIFANSIGVD